MKQEKNKDIEKIKETVNKTTEEIKEEVKNTSEDLKEKATDLLNDIKDTSKKYDKKDINENKAMACLSYIIPPIPYFVETQSKWVHYHAIQGMNLFIIYIILTLLITLLNSLILWILPFLTTLLRTILNVITIIYSLIGIINVCNAEAKELPIINKFKFIKK